MKITNYNLTYSSVSYYVNVSLTRVYFSVFVVVFWIIVFNFYVRSKNQQQSAEVEEEVANEEPAA